LLLSLAACSGSGYGLDANGQPTSGGGPPPLTPDLASIQANIFTPICTKCHIGAAAPQGLQLDAAHAYANLVGVPSQEQPTVLRVKPSDPTSSYIIQKLEGAPGITGGQMPLGGPYLPQSTINVIAQWITNGAPNSPATSSALARLSPEQPPASASTAAGLAVTGTSPAAGAVVDYRVGNIVVAFNHELDASLVNDTLIQLTALPDNTEAESTPTADPAPVPISVSLARGNPAAVVITPFVALGAGSYQVTVRGGAGGALGLADLSAHVLGHDESFAFTVELAR
jgi:hypothetical protein